MLAVQGTSVSAHLEDFDGEMIDVYLDEKKVLKVWLVALGGA
jgi:hypothetical protein